MSPSHNGHTGSTDPDLEDLGEREPVAGTRAAPTRQNWLQRQRATYWTDKETRRKRTFPVLAVVVIVVIIAILAGCLPRTGGDAQGPIPVPSSSETASPSSTASASATPSASPTASASPTPAPSDLEKEKEDAAKDAAKAAAKAAADKAAAEKAAAEKAAAEAAARAAADKRLAEIGFGAPTYTRDVDWAKANSVAPGADVFGNEKPTTATGLVDSLQRNAAIDHLPGDRAANLNPNQWVPVQATHAIVYKNGMLSIDQFGNVTSGTDFVDPAGAVLWVNLATGAIVRQHCLNPVTAAPVPTTEQPTFAPAPVTPTAPPVVRYTQVCNINTGLIETVPVGVFGPYDNDLNSPKCKHTPPPTPVCAYNPNLPPNDDRCLQPKSNDPADYKYPVDKPKVTAPEGPAETTIPVEQHPIDPAVTPGAPAPGTTAPGADPAPRPAPVPDPVTNAPTPSDPGTAIPDPDAVTAG